MAKAAYCILYDKVRNWLGEDNLQPFREKDLHSYDRSRSAIAQAMFLEDNGYIFTLRRLEMFLGRPIVIPQEIRSGYEKLERLEKEDQGATIPKDLIQYLIVRTTELDGTEKFLGRAVAILKKPPNAPTMPLQNLAMVPRHSRAGDYICYFGESNTPFILRRQQTSTPTDIILDMPTRLQSVDHAALPVTGRQLNECLN